MRPARYGAYRHALRGASADTTFTAGEFTQNAATDTLTLPSWTPADANRTRGSSWVLTQAA